MGYLIAEPRTGLPLSNGQIIREFVGQAFVFGIKLNELSQRDDVSAFAWPLTLRPWIEATLRNTDRRPCPKPVGQN